MHVGTQFVNINKKTTSTTASTKHLLVVTADRWYINLKSFLKKWYIFSQLSERDFSIKRSFFIHWTMRQQLQQPQPQHRYHYRIESRRRLARQQRMMVVALSISLFVSLLFLSFPIPNVHARMNHFKFMPSITTIPKPNAITGTRIVNDDVVVETNPPIDGVDLLRCGWSGWRQPW